MQYAYISKSGFLGNIFFCFRQLQTFFWHQFHEPVYHIYPTPLLGQDMTLLSSLNITYTSYSANDQLLFHSYQILHAILNVWYTSGVRVIASFFRTFLSILSDFNGAEVQIVLIFSLIFTSFFFSKPLEIITRAPTIISTTVNSMFRNIFCFLPRTICLYISFLSFNFTLMSGVMANSIR